METYVIGQTSGRQFIFQPGQWYDIDFLRSASLGDYLYLQKILFFRKEKQIQLGKPFLSGVSLPAKVLQSKVKGKKILVLKTKPKKKYTRRKGHRQSYTRIQIDQ